MWLGSTVGDLRVVDRLVNVKIDTSCVVVALLYKEMKLKPSILQEYSKVGGQMMPSAPKRNEKLHVDEADKMILEDETGRTMVELRDNTQLEDFDVDCLVSISALFWRGLGKWERREKMQGTARGG